MDLRSYLDDMGINYTWSQHDPAYTAQDLAMKEHVSGKRVVKPVVVQADGQFLLCALPASHYVDIEALRRELRANDARLAEEAEFAPIFPDCEPGAEPPIGALYGLTTIVDQSLVNEDRVLFQAGTHCDSVTVDLSDYLRASHPMIAQFGKQRA
jgi:Ala-tRNA(Pro) deacylase